jgi:hypothetical protein
MDAPVATTQSSVESPVPRTRRYDGVALNAEGLCERCANIPWEELAAASETSDDLMFPVHERLRDLEFSRCRVCRLFAHTILTHVNGFYPPPCNLRLCDANIFDNSRCKGLFFDNGTSRSPETESGQPRIPHLIITSLDARQAQAQLKHLYPEFIDIDQIGSWIDECSTTHDVSCRPMPTEGLNGLKVINCARRTIELASPKCKYVALSYVWGQASRFESPGSHDLRKTLPRTIEDSIAVTLALGYDYLWIDRYVRPASTLPMLHESQLILLVH